MFQGDTSGTGSDMTVLPLLPKDVTNIKESWASVEQQLVEVGIRVFVSILENQPNIKRTFRKYRSKRHSELRYILSAFSYDYQIHDIKYVGI